MSAFIDLTGNTFGRLTVLERAGRNQHGQVLWRCRCACGAEVVVQRGGLRSGGTKSCGCLKREIDGRGRKHVRHGMARSPEYESWKSMKKRCLRSNATDYPNYGGRGVTVCDSWRESFEAFLADMGPRPDGTTLDRIDNGGNYEPGNCRWATTVEQARNRRTNRLIEFRGESMTLAAWSQRSGVSQGALSARLDDGWPIERALCEPKRPSAAPALMVCLRARPEDVGL